MDYHAERLSPRFQRRYSEYYTRNSPTIRCRSPSPRPINRERLVSPINAVEDSVEFAASDTDFEDFSNRSRRNTMPVSQPFLLPPERFPRGRSNSLSPRNSPRSSPKASPRGSPTRKRSLVEDPRWRPDSWSNWKDPSKKDVCSRKFSLPFGSNEPTPATSHCYNVLILGAEDVGKGSLVDHLIGNEDMEELPNQDKSCRKLLFHLENGSIEIMFEAYKNVDAISTMLSAENTKPVDMFIIMYSLTDRRSFEVSSQLLTMTIFNYKRVKKDIAILLVGNKCDLVRARAVEMGEGKSLANRFEVDHAEVSVEIEHNFDQLVAWLTSNIKSKLGIKADHSHDNPLGKHALKRNNKLSAKALGFVKRLLQRKDEHKVRSCDNLHLM